MADVLLIRLVAVCGSFLSAVAYVACAAVNTNGDRWWHANKFWAIIGLAPLHVLSAWTLFAMCGGAAYLSRPQPEFPVGARSSRGEASVVCVVTARGTFRSCLVETESPSGNGFGRAAVASMQRGARIKMGSDGPVEGDRMRATLRFWNGQ